MQQRNSLGPCREHNVLWKGNGVPWLLGYLAPGPLSAGNPVCSGHWHNIYKKPEHTHCEIIGECMVCYVILFCPFLLFAGTGFFIREPQSFTGKTRQTLFGMSFLLSASPTFWWSPWKFCWPSAVIPSCSTSWSAAINPSPSFSLARASWLSFALSSSSLQPLLWDRMSPCPESLSLNVRRGPFLHLAPCWAILPSWPSCASFVPSKAGNYLTITMRPNS